MPPKRNLAVAGPSKAKNTQTATLKVTRGVGIAPIACVVNPSYDYDRYPWDDYQDSIVVNSVEIVPRYDINLSVGAEHYLQALRQRREEYKHICTHPDEYRKIYKDTPDLNEDLEEKHLEFESKDGDTYIDYTRAPSPLTRIEDYVSRIYTAQIINPSVFLAVIRIAQRNLQCLDFKSAINHLPNLPLHSPLPKLRTSRFTEDAPYERGHSDMSYTLAFLPYFYADGRHALGYYNLTPTAILTNPYSSPLLETCLFTPCTIRDLMKYRLVEWLPGTRFAEVQSMKAVGGREGRWLHKNLAEEWHSWEMVTRVMGQGWEKRLSLYCGEELEEDG